MEPQTHTGCVLSDQERLGFRIVVKLSEGFMRLLLQKTIDTPN